MDKQRKCSRRLMTKSEFADLLQVTGRTIDRWLADGLLPRELQVRVGGSVRFYVDEMDNVVRTLQEHRDTSQRHVPRRG